MNKLLPQNVRDIIRDIIRDRHRLLPQKLVLLLYMDRKASVSARREGIVVSQLKTVLNDKFRAYD